MIRDHNCFTLAPAPIYVVIIIISIAKTLVYLARAKNQHHIDGDYDATSFSRPGSPARPGWIPAKTDAPKPIVAGTSHSPMPHHNVIAEPSLVMLSCIARQSGRRRGKGRQYYHGAPGF
jgi:hypothetical protein